MIAYNSEVWEHQNSP